MARPAIFPDKAGGSRYQGIVTRVGAVEFEKKRRALAILAEVELHKVSDADVMEYMARGEDATVEYLAKSKSRK